MRVITLGNRGHPFANAAIKVSEELPGVEHVGHIDTDDERPFMCDPDSSAFLLFLRDASPDLLVSAGYGRILHEAALAIPSIGAINIHPGALPRYRGCNPLLWALFDGEPRASVTVHEMILSVDSGSILAVETLTLNGNEDPRIAYLRLAELSAVALRRTLEGIQMSGEIRGRPQAGLGSYRSTTPKEFDRLIPEWSLPAEELVRRSRVFQGYMNIPLGRRRIFIARMLEAGETTAQPGTIIRRRFGTWEVAAGDGRAVRLEFNRPGRVWLKVLESHVRFRESTATGDVSRRGAANHPG